MRADKLRIAPLYASSVALAAATFVLACAAGAEAPATEPAAIDPIKITRASQVKATAGPDGVVRISWARTDVAVTVDGAPLDPAAGLTSWAAFTPAGRKAIMMGDTVVFEDEVGPAMDAAFETGLEVTALHNHFFYDQPRVYFMHLYGTGDPERLAAAVKGVWDSIRSVRVSTPEPATASPGDRLKSGKLTAETLDAILGASGQLLGGVVKYSFGHEGRMHGVAIGESMGLATWAAFTGSDELAAVDGDFIMTGTEVQPVLQSLRKSGINIVALHNHMIGGEPEYYFAHFWGKAAATTLAKGIRAALDAQAQSARQQAAPRRASK